MSAVGSPKKAVTEPVAAPANVNNNAKTKRRAPRRKAAGKPKTADMVGAAISAIKDRKGSSLAAIKKHVCANNKVDATRINALIRMALKRGVAAGTFKQASGTGASGRFRMGAKPKAPRKKKAKKAKKPKKKKARKAKKPKKAKKAKKPKAKKAKKAKKPAKKAKKPAKKAAKKARPAKKAAKKPKAAKRPKAAKKAKRATKAKGKK